ncbi:DNA primase small subunit [Cryptococcus neoformans]|nr:DNA primase small subunit [Cryptococcus neoformans var. grubii]OXC61203.1 DNA primase small subunit [Cryptococcus neoformans var. grubii MW-RSA852]
MPVPISDKPMVEYDASSPQVMQLFYRRLFPYRPLYLWLNQEQIPSKLFTHREFAFTLAGDVYLRYQSFNNVDEFKISIARHIPSRFEIGPQYSARPKDRKTLASGALQPQRRELVFDIDMTDYDEIRTCCTDKTICRRCWGFIAAAVKVLDHSLRETFGFKHLLWVYSGRRGIHCWISDQSALDLTDDQRRALVTFLEVIKGGKEQNKKVNVRGPIGDAALHPFLSEALDTLKPLFSSLCIYDQDCFKGEKGWEALLSILPTDRTVIGPLRAKWEKNPDSSSDEKWRELMSEIAKHKKEEAIMTKFTKAIEDVVLQYTYPRIDAEVSKHRNHLLKSPFCVHPGTGRVCVPINPSLIDEFDPDTVPTVGQLLNELDNVKPEDSEAAGRRMEDYEHTSLGPYVEMFEKHVAAILRDSRNAKRAAKTESLDF